MKQSIHTEPESQAGEAPRQDMTIKYVDFLGIPEILDSGARTAALRAPHVPPRPPNHPTSRGDVRANPDTRSSRTPDMLRADGVAMMGCQPKQKLYKTMEIVDFS